MIFIFFFFLKVSHYIFFSSFFILKECPMPSTSLRQTAEFTSHYNSSHCEKMAVNFEGQRVFSSFFFTLKRSRDWKMVCLGDFLCKSCWPWMVLINTPTHRPDA